MNNVTVPQPKKRKDQLFVKLVTRVLATLVLALLLGTVAVFAQGGDTLSGKYEGTVKSAGAADVALTLELKNEAGKVTGTLSKGQTPLAISEGTIVEGKLSLKFGDGGKDGMLVAKVEGDKISGEWTAGPQKSAVELKKVAAAGAAVSLPGQWMVADANGQACFPSFSLSNSTVRKFGSSASQLGEASITSVLKDALTIL